jgi:hypothetical protein
MIVAALCERRILFLEFEAIPNAFGAATECPDV